MMHHIRIFLALTVFGLSAFLAGLNGGYHISRGKAIAAGLFHADEFFRLFLGYIWISVWMLVFFAITTLGKGLISKVISFASLIIAILYYCWIIRSKSFFTGEALNSHVFTWAFPIDIMIALSMLGLLVMQFVPKRPVITAEG